MLVLTALKNVNSEPPEEAKTVRVSSQEEPKTAKVRAREEEEPRCSWRLGTLRTDYPKQGGWGAIQPADLKLIINTLAYCDKTPWLTLKSARSSQIGGIAIYDVENIGGKFEKKARRLLRGLNEGIGIERVTRIRLGGKKRLWAIHHPDNTLDILWWDPDHKVYPTKR